MPQRAVGGRMAALAVLLFAGPAAGQAGPPVDSARQSDLLDQAPRVVETPTFRARLLSLDMADGELGELRMELTNPSGHPVVAAVQYGTHVGGWFADRNRGTGDIFVYHIPPDTTVDAVARIIVAGYSPDATLRVDFGPGEETPARPGHGKLLDVAATRTYGLSRSPWARASMDRFAEVDLPGLQMFARRGTGLAAELPRLARERQQALAAVAGLLHVEPPARIRVVLYPDATLKWLDTGHFGNGWAFDSTVVEVVGDGPPMDPYHEATHVLMGGAGSPPAVFREGLAIYAAERLGGDALAFLGRDVSVDSAVCADVRAGRLMALSRLINFQEIGDEETQPAVTYPESASFVGFLIARMGLNAFLQAYRAMPAAGTAQTAAADTATQTLVTEEAFQQAFGLALHSAESRWLDRVLGRCGS